MAAEKVRVWYWQNRRDEQTNEWEVVQFKSNQSNCVEEKTEEQREVDIISSEEIMSNAKKKFSARWWRQKDFSRDRGSNLCQMGMRVGGRVEWSR